MIKYKYLKAFLLYVITCLLHKSAIMLIFIMPFVFIRIKNHMAYLVLLLSLLGEVLSTIFSEYMVLAATIIELAYPELASNIISYSNSSIAGLQEKSAIHILLSFLLSLILIYGILKGRDNLERSPKTTPQKLRVYNIYMNCFIIFTFISKFFSSESLSNLVRMIEFFSLGYAISITLAYTNIVNKNSKLFLFGFFIIYYIVKMKAIIYDNPYPNEFYPYYSIFDSSLRSTAVMPLNY